MHTEDAKLPVLIPGVDLFNVGPVDTHLDIDQDSGIVRIISNQEYVLLPTPSLQLSLSLRIRSKTLEDQKIVVRRDQMTGK